MTSLEAEHVQVLAADRGTGSTPTDPVRRCGQQGAAVPWRPLEHREQLHRHPLAHLDAEQSLYRHVISSAHGRGVRLEQEGVRFWRVQDAL